MTRPDSHDLRTLRSQCVTTLAIVGGAAILLGIVLGLTEHKLANGETWSRELERVPAPAAPATSASSALEGPKPRNLILVIADGMGFPHLTAGRVALYGIDGEAVWDAFPMVGWHRSHPARGLLTDSASAATALAAGRTTRYGFVGVDESGAPLPSLFELAAERGYRTGVITDSYIWDATPAAFAAHVQSREEARSILEQLAAAKLDVLFGELEDVGEGEVPEWEESVEILRSTYELRGPEPITAEELTAAAPGSPLAAIFKEEQITDLDSTPSLPTLVRAGLERITRSNEPFVLLVESEEIDSASHRGDLDRMLKAFEVLEVVLTDLLEFGAEDGETLIVFTSDHETGGLAISTRRGNRALRAIWASYDHTAEAVPIFAIGPGAELFVGQQSIAEVGQKLLSLLGRPGSEAGEAGTLPMAAPRSEPGE